MKSTTTPDLPLPLDLSIPIVNNQDNLWPTRSTSTTIDLLLEAKIIATQDQNPTTTTPLTDPNHPATPLATTTLAPANNPAPNLYKTLLIDMACSPDTGNGHFNPLFVPALTQLDMAHPAPFSLSFPG